MVLFDTVSCIDLGPTNYLHGVEYFLRSWQVHSYSRHSPRFMEPEGSLPRSQEPTTCPYPEPNRSSPCPHPASRRSILILSPVYAWVFQVVCSVFILRPIRATCPVYLSLLDLITRIIFGEEHRAWSSSLCSLLCSPLSLRSKYPSELPVLSIIKYSMISIISLRSEKEVLCVDWLDTITWPRTVTNCGLPVQIPTYLSY